MRRSNMLISSRIFLVVRDDFPEGFSCSSFFDWTSLPQNSFIRRQQTACQIHNSIRCLYGIFPTLKYRHIKYGFNADKRYQKQLHLTLKKSFDHKIAVKRKKVPPPFFARPLHVWPLQVVSAHYPIFNGSLLNPPAKRYLFLREKILLLLTSFVNHRYVMEKNVVLTLKKSVTTSLQFPNPYVWSTVVMVETAAIEQFTSVDTLVPPKENSWP